MDLNTQAPAIRHAMSTADRIERKLNEFAAQGDAVYQNTHRVEVEQTAAYRLGTYEELLKKIVREIRQIEA